VICACAKGTGAIVDFKDALETIKSSSDVQETATTANSSNNNNKSSNEEETATVTTQEDDDDDDDDEDFGSDSKTSTSNKRVLKTATQDEDDDEDEDIGGSSSKTTNNRSLKKAIVDDDDDDDVDFGGDSQPSKTVRFIDDEAADDDDEEDGPAKNKQQAPETSTTTDDDDLDDDRMPVGTNDYLEDDDDMDDDVIPRFLPTQQQQRLPPPQPAFSPSSTPLDLARRFLCWNHIGAITMVQGGDRNTIDITFTDSAYKRPISFTDNIHFLLGSLGEDGGIFASDLQQGDSDDIDNPDLLDDLNMSERTKQAIAKSHQKRVNSKPTGSSIFFYRFETFGNMRDKDWYLTLPDGERVLGSACGGGWAAVMTR
jgi:hypothetical protein